jgi:choline dehydrogenase
MILSPLALTILSIATLGVHGFPEGNPGEDASFDYVVVGSGTSGLTLDAQLAEANFTVALVEAGDFYENTRPLPKIPGAAVVEIGASPSSTTPIDWNFITEPVPGEQQRQVHYCRHRTVGGGSAANVMIYQRLHYSPPSLTGLERRMLIDGSCV